MSAKKKRGVWHGAPSGAVKQQEIKKTSAYQSSDDRDKPRSEWDDVVRAVRAINRKTFYSS